MVTEVVNCDSFTYSNLKNRCILYIDGEALSINNLELNRKMIYVKDNIDLDWIPALYYKTKDNMVYASTFDNPSEIKPWQFIRIANIGEIL